MNVLTSFAGLDWAERIGITLVHSLWQIALFAIAYALALFVLRPRSAQIRYIAGCCVLAAMLAAPLSTYLVLSNTQAEMVVLTDGSSQNPRGSESEAIPNPASGVSMAVTPANAMPSAAAGTTASMAYTPVAGVSAEPPAADLMGALRGCLPWATAVWILGVIVLALRPLWGWLHLVRVRRHGLSPLPEALQIGGQRAMRRLGVHRAVRFVQSALVEVPTVVGFLRPMVLLPASVVSGLSTEEIALILAHELAHVRRHDWIVNLAQVVGEALLFYHPAMWWVSGQIRAERENCCDDIAVAAEGCRATYVRTLAHLEELRHTTPVTAVAATGGSLIARVRRLSGKPVGGCGYPRFGVCLAAPMILAIAAMVIAVAMATGGTEGRPASDGAPPQATSPLSDANNQTKVSAESKSTEEPTFKLTVQDAQGNPIPHAKVHHGRVDRDKKRTYYPRTADEQGVVLLKTTRPENIGWFSFSVKTAGHAPFYGQWDNWDSSDPPPSEFTVRLKKGKTIGGIVKNEQGEPVKGVTVSFSFPYGPDGMRRDDHTGCAASGKSDAEGRWTCGYVPAQLQGRQRFTLSYPDYKTCQFEIPLSELAADDKGEFPHVMVISKGYAISGTVQDAAGRPLADANVSIELLDMTGSEEDCVCKMKTDQKGAYRFKNCPLGPALVVARSPGNATVAKSCDIRKQTEPVDFTMTPGKSLSLRVVDQEGHPIEDASFYVRTWRESRSIAGNLLSRDNQRTDAEGRFIWIDPPQDEMEIEVFAEDHMSSKALPMRAGDEEHVFKLYPVLKISGTVTDESSGKPIPKFTVTPGIFYTNVPTRVNWLSEKTRDCQDGQYAIRQDYPYPGYALRIEEEGYIPQESRKIEISEGAVTLDFSLKKVDEAYLRAQNEQNRLGPRGVVLTPEGKPAAGATLGFANRHMGAYIESGVLHEESHRYFTHTDDQGRFTVPQLKPRDGYPSAPATPRAVAGKEPYTIVVLHESGFAYLDYDEIQRRTAKDATVFDSPIQLQRWARVEGRLMFGDKPAAQCPVSLQVERPLSTEPSGRVYRQPDIWFDYKTTTDHQGRFVFDSVPPEMAGSVARTIDFARDGHGMSGAYSHGVPVVFHAGKTTQVQMGGGGRPVIGQLRYADDFPDPVDWRFALVRMKHPVPTTPRPTSLTFPASLEAARKRILEEYADRDKLNALQRTPDWEQTEAGKEYLKRLRELADFNKSWQATEEGKAYMEQVEKVKRERDAWNAKRSEAEQYPLCSAVDSQGRFRVEDVPPGDWVLSLEITNPRSRTDDSVPDQLLRKELPKTVPDAPDGRPHEPLDFGVLTLGQSAD